jgi:hypothetical protein
MFYANLLETSHILHYMPGQAGFSVLKNGRQRLTQEAKGEVSVP